MVDLGSSNVIINKDLISVDWINLMVFKVLKELNEKVVNVMDFQINVDKKEVVNQIVEEEVVAVMVNSIRSKHEVIEEGRAYS